MIIQMRTAWRFSLPCCITAHIVQNLSFSKESASTVQIGRNDQRWVWNIRVISIAIDLPPRTQMTFMIRSFSPSSTNKLWGRYHLRHPIDIQFLQEQQPRRCQYPSPVNSSNVSHRWILINTETISLRAPCVSILDKIRTTQWSKGNKQFLHLFFSEVIRQTTSCRHFQIQIP